MLATLSATRSGDLLAQGQPTAEALTGGYPMAFLIAAGLVVAAVAVALAVLRPETDTARQAEPRPEAGVEAERGEAPGLAEPAPAHVEAERAEAHVEAEPVCCQAFLTGMQGDL